MFLQFCDELNRAFAAIRSGQPCRELMTPLIKADINRSYQSDYLLSAAVNAYFHFKSFENVDCLLELGADPSCGSWNAQGEYLNDGVYDYSARWASIGSIEYATRMDDLDLLKRLITCTKCTESYIMYALHEARAGTQTRKYLFAVSDQLDLLSPTKYRCHVHNWPVHRKGMSYLLTLQPMSPILVLKSIEDGPLREFQGLYQETMTCLRNLRIAFSKQSAVAVLPVDMLNTVAAFLNDFNAEELDNLKKYGRLLDLGFIAETYFSYACVYRIQNRDRRTRW